jgi:uncharacterized protein
MDIIATHRRWQAARHAELAGPESWLGLVGLFWLEAGANTVGSSAAAAVRLPSGPERLGELRWTNGRILWAPVDGAGVELASDRDGPPTAVDAGNLSFFIVDRDGRLAARVRDRDWAAARPFAGVDCFPYEPAWRIVADWLDLVPPLTMAVPDASGELKRVEVGQRAAFAVAGQGVELLPMAVGDDGVFFVFRDRTSGRETYGAGRFLKVPAAVDGRIVLDFNFAYSPPCAFTSFATCPLPPPENWLPFAVPAGEKKPG